MSRASENSAANLPLQIGLLITMAVGAAMVVAPGLAMQFFGLLIFQNADTMLNWPDEAQQYVKLAHAVMGSVMMGWALLMLTFARLPFQCTRSTVVKALSASLIVWYVPDTLASLFYGFWQNALFNTSFLVMLMLPIYWAPGGVYDGSEANRAS